MQHKHKLKLAEDIPERENSFTPLERLIDMESKTVRDIAERIVNSAKYTLSLFVEEPIDYVPEEESDRTLIDQIDSRLGAFEESLQQETNKIVEESLISMGKSFTGDLTTFLERSNAENQQRHEFTNDALMRKLEEMGDEMRRLADNQKVLEEKIEGLKTRQTLYETYE